MGTITTSLLEGCGRCIDTNIHTMLFGRGRGHLKKKVINCYWVKETGLQVVLLGYGSAQTLSTKSCKFPCVGQSNHEKGAEGK